MPAGVLPSDCQYPTALEIDALYCDAIVSRWEQSAGRKAERVAAPQEAAHAEG